MLTTCLWFLLCASAFVFSATSYANPIPGGVQQTSGTVTTTFSGPDPLFLRRFLSFFFFLLLLLLLVVFSVAIASGGRTATAGGEYRPHPNPLSVKNPNNFFRGESRSPDSATRVEFGVAVAILGRNGESFRGMSVEDGNGNGNENGNGNGIVGGMEMTTNGVGLCVCGG